MNVCRTRHRSSHASWLPFCYILWSVASCVAGAFTAGTNDSPFVSTAWYTGWHYNDVPLANVSWSKYTHMSYAFATTIPNAPFVALDPSDSPKLTQFVAQAHQNGVKATLAIGGWTSSRWFSYGAGSATNRTQFATAVAQLISTYKLDGVDFDWEFPTSAGIGCNTFSPNDTNNYLAFLRELRQSSSGSNAIISLAVSTKPFNDSSGQAADLSEFSKVIDFIEIMDYDIKSSPSVGAGPSSPLNDTCAPSGARFGSAVPAVEAWVAAGIPADQIVLGVPGYGRSFAVTPSDAFLDAGAKTLASYPQYNPKLQRAGDKWDGGWGVDVCGDVQGPGGTYNYWSLIDGGILDQNGTVRDGISYRYDNCSQTPFTYDPNAQLLISFENPTSLKAKGQFIKASGLKGFAMWEAGSDYHDVLLDAMSTCGTDPVLAS
ncbi:glycoside hydrolase family 18 protein [Amanita muscaria]